MAPLAIAGSPATKLIVETAGSACRYGQTLMKPSFEGETTVTLNATAFASLGMPQRPLTGKFRWEPAVSDGGPLVPVNPLPPARKAISDETFAAVTAPLASFAVVTEPSASFGAVTEPSA